MSVSLVECKLETYEKNKDLVFEWTKSLQYEMGVFYEDLFILNPKTKFYVIYLNISEEAVRAGYFIIMFDAVVAFFIRRKYQLMVDPKDVFKIHVLDKFGVKSANLSSIDTYFLNVLLDHQKSIKVMGLASFILERKEVIEISHKLDFKEPILAKLEQEEAIWEVIKDEKYFMPREEFHLALVHERMLLFYQKSDEKNEVIGGFGVRQFSDIFERATSIGMWVNPKFRRQRVGTYILQWLHNDALKIGNFTISGCAAENTPSRKTLQKSGMINRGSFIMVSMA